MFKEFIDNLDCTLYIVKRILRLYVDIAILFASRFITLFVSICLFSKNGLASGGMHMALQQRWFKARTESYIKEDA